MMRRSVPLMVSAAVFAVCGYALNVFLARLLGPTAYGEIGLTLSVISLATVILTAGVPTVVARDVAGCTAPTTEPLRTGLHAQLMVAAVLTGAVIMVSPAVVRLNDGLTGVALIIVAALALPGYGAMTGFAGYWNGLRRFWRQSALVSTYSVGKVLLVVPLALWLGPVGAILGYALAPAFGIAIGWTRITATGTGRSAKETIRLSIPFSALALCTLAMYSVDLYILAAFTEDTAIISFYVVAQSIGLIPLTAFSAFSQVSTPTVARLVASGETARARRAIVAGLRDQLVLLVPVVALLVVYAEPLVWLLYGQLFIEAAVTVKVLVPAYAVLAVLLYLCGCLNGAGASSQTAASAAVGLVMTAATCALLTPSLGPIGAALGLAAGAIVATLMALRALRALLPLHSDD